MERPVVDAFLRVLAWLLAGFAFRCVPFVVYSLLSKNVEWDAKVMNALLLTSILLAADALGMVVTTVLHTPIALAYFALVSIGLYAVRFWAARMPRAAVLALAAAGYVLLPALAVRSVIVVPMLVVGWEAMLSAYSYLQDTKDGKVPARLSDCLFFILVNPVLVFAERGVKLDGPDFHWAGAWRCVVGLLTWAAQAFAGLAIAGWAQSSRATTDGAGKAPFLVLFWTNAFVLYLAHSGLASVQIGLMRLAGWRVPERYNYPFLATSPADFWRRWNTYIGSWARRYLFLPWALSLGRSGWFANPAAKATAALVTFVAVGALHAFIQYLALRAGEPRQWGPLHVMGLFTAFGLLFIVWEGIVRYKPVSRGIERLRPGQARLVASWLLFSNVMCIMTWLALSSFE